MRKLFIQLYLNLPFYYNFSEFLLYLYLFPIFQTLIEDMSTPCQRKSTFIISCCWFAVVMVQEKCSFSIKTECKKLLPSYPKLSVKCAVSSSYCCAKPLQLSVHCQFLCAAKQRTGPRPCILSYVHSIFTHQRSRLIKKSNFDGLNFDGWIYTCYISGILKYIILFG